MVVGIGASLNCRLIKAFYLLVDVLAIVLRHLHAVVEIVKSGVAHLEGLEGDGAYSAQIGLITLVLKDRLLSNLDLQLLLQLRYHSFEELDLVLFVLDFCLDLKGNHVLYFSFVHFVAGSLNVELVFLEGSREHASFVKFNTVFFFLSSLNFFLSPLHPKFK